MRFDIKTAPMNTTWQAMLDVWKEADRIEMFETAWNFDHFEPIFSDRSGPCIEAWSMLAAMAGHTSRIRLGCGDGHAVSTSGGAREHRRDHRHHL